MWSDIETSKDLLGYSVHASLLKDVVTNEKNLPITVGLYGDWGCGKSSILKILKEQLEKDDDCVVVYFDGWSFESFDDAKMALIQGIVDALEADERFFAKVKDDVNGACDKLKHAFKELRKSISWMRALKLTAKAIIPIATASATGGASLISLLLDAFQEHKGDLENILTGDEAEKFIKNTINYEDDKKYEAVREFRKQFEELIKKSKQGKVVILIDDLDRCLPRHIIENLEAIKLFLNVPQTAFVIAADRFIVSNAIKSEYKAIIEAASDEKRPNLGDSYMEKFIQLPYNIPALSRKEVETYVTLLFCQSLLNVKDFDKVQADFMFYCMEHKFDRYGWTRIRNVLGENQGHQELGETIGFVTRFSSIIGQSLRWNPRLIKRFLNAYEIRANLLSKNGVQEQRAKFALLKLMLIEQQHIDQFKQLNRWVMSAASTPMELLDIETYAQSDRNDDFKYKEWNHPELLQIMADEPLLSSVDLRELFWVSRDNIIDEMSGISLIPSKIRIAFKNASEAASENIREKTIRKEVSQMSQEELKDFFDLTDKQIMTDPKSKNGYCVYLACDKEGIDGAYLRFSGVLSRIDTTQIPFSLGNRFKTCLESHNNDARLWGLLVKNSALKRTIESAQ